MPPKKTAAPIRLLLVDASPDFGERLQGQLRGAGHNVRVERVATRPALEEAISRRDADLLLVDWESPIVKVADVVAMVERERIDLPVIAMAVSIDAGMLIWKRAACRSSAGWSSVWTQGLRVLSHSSGAKPRSITVGV